MRDETKQEYARKLYNMKLHEVIRPNNGSIMITRVPGGWIYTFPRLDYQQMNSVFVPLSDDLNPKDYNKGY